jgi:plastocyanin
VLLRNSIPGRWRQSALVLVLIALSGIAIPFLAGQSSTPGTIVAPTRGSASGLLPLYFIQNEGQVDGPVHFLAHSGGGTLFFTSDGVTLSLPSASQTSQGADSGSVASDAASGDAVSPSTVINLQFLGASSAAQVTGGSLLPGKVNYFLGSDPSRWHRDLPTYSQVSYSGLYPGISLLYEGAAGRLKGTYALAAGTDPTAIRWRYSGAQSTNVDSQGNLHIGVPGENAALMEQAPVAWQEIAGNRVPVQAHYSVATDGSIGFLVGSYDHSHPLTIDPGFVYSTYLGGEDVDRGHAIAADSSGNAYVTGLTHSLDFPIANAYQPVHGNDDELADSFVTKIGPNGTMVYSTFLGGDGHDIGEGVLVDGSGNVYLSGSTGSSDFPATAGAYQGTPRGGFDIFITKLNSAGSGLIFSTYLGGSSGDAGAGLAVDSQGNVYVAGTTNSQNYPTLNAVQTQLNTVQDVFVTKMNASGTALVYSTYLGGEEILEEEGLGVAVNSLGEAYVTGFTDATDFPLMNPLKPTLVPGKTDAIVTKLSASGSSLIYSTYLGGDGSNETAHDIAVDADGNAYITGLTYSGNFPVVNAFQPQPGGNGDAFVSKINSAGTAFVYSTYLGGFSIEIAFDIHVDEANNAYVTGYTGSEDFPVLNPFQPQYGGFYDAFVTKLAPSGSAVVYSGYLGGSSYEHGRGITSGGGNTYVTGLVSSEDFPIVNAFQTQMGGDGSFDDAFVTKISEQGGATLTPTPTPVCPPSTAQVDILNSSYQPQQLTVSLGATVTWTNRDQIIHTTTSDTGVWHSFDMYPNQEFPVEFDTPGTYPYHCVYHSNMTGVITVLDGCLGTPTGTAVPPTGTATGSVPTDTAIAGTSTPSSVAATLTPSPSATEAIPTVCSITFSDVPESHTFYPFVRCLACRGIISGYADDTFRPGNDITRGQIAKVVSNAAGYNESPGAQIYEDVPASNTFYVWINRLSRRGHMGGYNCGGAGEPCGTDNKPYFRPNANATRGQLAKIVASTKGINSTPTGQRYTDVEPDSTFYVWIEQLSSLGVMGGYACSTVPTEPCDDQNRPYFRPSNNVTRGQSSKIVANTFFPNCQAPARK